MGSIPLPALGLQPVQGTDPLSAAAKVLTMKSLLQNQQFQQQEQPLELQQKQQQVQAQAQQLQDQTAARQLFQQAYAGQQGAEGQAPQAGAQPAVPGAVPSAAPQPGQAPGAPQQPAANNRLEMPSDSEILAKAGPVLGPQLVNNLLDISKKRKDLETAEATIQEKTDAHQQSVRDALGNFGIEVQKHNYDPTWANQAFSTLAQLNPSFQQALAPIQAQIAQGGPPALKQLADNWAQLSPKAQSDAAELASKQAGTQKTQAEIPGAQAESQTKQHDLDAMNQWLAQHPGKTSADYAVTQAGKKAGAEAGARLGSEEALDKYHMDLQRGMLPQELHGVAPQLVPAAASQYEKSSTEYAGARAAAQEMQQLIDLARGGNKISYAYAPTTGVLTINSANGVKRVNMAEIGSYQGAGSAVDRITGWLGKQATGASIDPSILNDMEQVHSNLAATSQKKYANEVQATNATYGSKFKPQDFGGSGTTIKGNGSTQPQGQPVYQGGKLIGYSTDGKTMTPAQ